jgi:EAL domain-containing protein (putative c-di-GMP-specific phosphodiesterase class I)
MHKIDQLLMRVILKQMTIPQPAGETPTLFFVNLSGDVLRHRDIVVEFADALRTDAKTSARARSLVLKISEQQVSTGAEQVVAALAPLLELGCRLAIGDCGSDASSYRFVTDLPVDFLELDADLIRLAAESPRARAILTGIVKAANEIGQTTIAKQVEDQATLNRLLELGVDWGQGYLFGRPTDPTLDENG